MTGKPAPVATADTAAFWAACRDGVLTFQRCRACAESQFYPGAVCRRCRSTDLAWERSGGLGTVHSFTVVHRAPSAAFRADVPYVLALIDMEEGFRIMANVLDCDPRDVAIGMPVAVVFESRGPDGQAIPQAAPRR